MGRVGRPPKGSEVNPRTVRRTTRLTAEEAETLDRRAAALGLTVSDYLRAKALPDGDERPPTAILPGKP